MPPFDPDKYIAKKQADDFNPDEYLKNKAPESSKVLSAMAGFGQGATLGFADEAVAGIKGAADVLDAAIGRRGDISFYDAYRTHRDAIRRGNKKLQDDNPATYKTAEIVGGVAPVIGAIAGAPAVAGGGAATVAAGGAIAGQGYSDADFGTAQNIFDTTLGAGASLLTLGGIKVGGKIAQELTEKISAKAVPVFNSAKEKLSVWLRNFAEERAAKAAIGGGNKKAFSDLAAKKGGVSKFGRAMLDEKVTNVKMKDGEIVEETTRGLLSPGATSEQIAERAGERLKEVGKVFDEVFEAVDDTFEEVFKRKQEAELGKVMASETLSDVLKFADNPPAPKAVDTVSIAQKMIDFADKELNNPNTRHLFDKVYKQADEFAKMGSISMKRAQQLRNTYKFKPRHDSGADVLPADVQNKLKMIIGDQMDETIKMIDSMTPNSTGLYPVFKRAKELYGNLKTAKDAGDKAAVRELANRFASPTDHATGLAVMAADAAATGGMSLPAVAKGFAIGGINKLVRGRGNSTVAVAADRLSDLLQKNPKSLGPYGPMLIGAARQGQQALGNLHQILWRTDEKYRSLLSLESPSRSSSLSAKPNPKDAQRDAIRRRLEKK